MIWAIASDEIRELDKAIEIVKVLPSEKIKNIYFEKNIKIESVLSITHQPHHKEENLDTNNIIAEIK